MTDTNENVEILEVEDSVETENETPVVEETPEPTVEERLAELEATIISEDYEVTQKDRLEAIKEHRNVSTKLNEAWSLEAIKAFLEMGIEPEKTSTGVYVEDVTRANKKASGWSDEEVVAWIKGELEATGKASVGALAQSAVSRFKLKVKGNDPKSVINAYNVQVEKIQPEVEETVPTAVETTVAAAQVTEVKPTVKNPVEIKQEGLTPMNQRYIEDTLNRYIETLKPGKSVTQAEGVLQQKALDTLIRYILNLTDPSGFRNGMDYLLKVIKSQRADGVFNDTYAMRFSDNLPVSGNVQENHNRLLTLFFTFVDGDEAIIKQTDVAYLLEFVPADKQPLLLQYFEQYSK